VNCSERQGTPIAITNVALYTRPEAAPQIVNSNGFTGKMKKINENEEARFSWWSPIFTSDDKTNVRDRLGEVIQPLIGENDSKSICVVRCVPAKCMAVRKQVISVQN